MQDSQDTEQHELYEYWVADFDCRAYTDNLRRSTRSSTLEGLNEVVTAMSQQDSFEYLNIKLYRRFQFAGVKHDLRVASTTHNGTKFDTKDDFFAELNGLKEKVESRLEKEGFPSLFALKEALNKAPKFFDSNLPDLKAVAAYQAGNPLWVVFEGSTEMPEKYDQAKFELESAGGYEREPISTLALRCHLEKKPHSRALSVYLEPLQEDYMAAEGQLFRAEDAHEYGFRVFSTEGAAHSYYQKILQTALDISRARKNEQQMPAPNAARPEI